MPLLGLIPEPPFNPLSWSGSSAPFFNALRSGGLLASAAEIRLPSGREAIEKSRALAWPLERWKENYHASVPRFAALTKVAGALIEREPNTDAVLQIGAWFSSGSTTRLPCFSYHDGNAALWYRYYGRGLLSDRRRSAHLTWERSVYAQLRGIFVMSSWLASSFIEDFGVPSSKVHVVGAGMNIGELPRVPERDFSRPGFLFVGRDFDRKGGRFLLEAFRQVRRVVKRAELVIVGPDFRIDEPGVRCEGFLSRSKERDVSRLRDLFVSSTAIVLPSIYEPFGIALVEGMAYGLPCIATNRCAMPEIVRHTESGLIVAAEDSTQLAAAMVDLASNPDKAAEMGRVGRRRAEQEYTWEAVAKKMGDVLSNIYELR
jgi:glycosyltransferase involved in cell wall biosynthesis